MIPSGARLLLACTVLQGIAPSIAWVFSGSSFLVRQTKNVAPWDVSSNVSPRRSSSALQMKVMWDPYTGQFIDTGDDQVSEIGVPSRPPPPPASAPTGLKSSDLKIAGGNVGKANAYMAAKLAEEAAKDVDKLIKEMEDMTMDSLAPGEEATWPEITDKMKDVIRNEQQAGLENVRRTVDVPKSVVFACGKPSPLSEAVTTALKSRGATLKTAKLDGLDPKAAMGANVILLLPDGKDAPLLPFGKSGGAGLEAAEVEAMIHAAGDTLRHMVFVSSLGAEKAGLQFSLNNLDGHLDKLKGVEQAIRRLSKVYGFSFSIMRVGPLGPAKAGEDGLVLEASDTLTGSTSVTLASNALLKSMELPAALNATFSIISTRGSPPTDDEWQDNFLKLVGPEIQRTPLKYVDVQEARKNVRAWALAYMEGDRKLTTKVFATRTPLGAKIYFLPTMNVLGASFREEKAIEKARMKGDASAGAKKPTRPILEGGLEVCVDETPCPRVRVRRIAVEEGTVIKAMSEKELLSSLMEEVAKLEAAAAKTKP